MEIKGGSSRLTSSHFIPILVDNNMKHFNLPAKHNVTSQDQQKPALHFRLVDFLVAKEENSRNKNQQKLQLSIEATYSSI